jgi:two-component system phosphate regulon sensor histidine kinase PhoR
LNSVWARTLANLAATALAGLVLWPLAGGAWAWALVALVLTVIVLRHATNLAALAAWLRRPTLRSLPEGSGIWEDVLTVLHGYLKHRDTEHADAVRMLGRFHDAARALPDGVILLDAESRIVWANPTAQWHFGIDAQRDAGQPVVHLVRHPDFVAYMGRGEFDQPLALRAAERDRLLSVRVFEFGADQKLLSSRDVTLEARIEAMRRDFVANVSHELKTPVTVLAGFVETLADETLALTPQRRKRFLDLMAEEARRMQRLIDDLLTLSALEAADTPRREELLNMRSFVEQLGEEARALSGARHRISVLIESDARLTGDEQELHSAFSNLVSNAVRYTPEGGSIALAWRAVEGRGAFSVTDSGPGIEARHLPRLTERFYRVDKSRSRETGGTGLGLAIVKHVLTRHGASLEIDSEPGRGSTFRAVFPASRLAMPDAAPAAAVGAQETRS